MAEPTIIALIQAIFLLIFPFGFFTLFASVWRFYQYLECHAPSQRHLHHKPQWIINIPARQTKRSGKKKRFHEKMKRRQRKMSVLTYPLVSATFWVGCCVEIAPWKNLPPTLVGCLHPLHQHIQRKGADQMESQKGCIEHHGK